MSVDQMTAAIRSPLYRSYKSVLKKTSVVRHPLCKDDQLLTCRSIMTTLTLGAAVALELSGSLAF